MADAHQTTESLPAGACPTEAVIQDSPNLFQSGVLTFQAHHVGWIVSSFFAIVATAVSIWLIVKHLTWYTKPKQQRQIVRLLLMVPIYSIISCMAYFFWNHAVPLALIRDSYEGIILASFFYLLLQYLEPTPAEQKEYFRIYKLDKWAWPFGWVKRKPDGLYFLQLMKWSILQYCWIRPLTSFAAVILDMAGIYCEASWSPRFGSVWILIIVSVSVSVAMYCLIQFYLSISDRIKQHKPLLQLFSIKAIIFLMFWQSSFLSALHSMHVIKDTKYMTAVDINVGFAALLQTFEMVLFAFLHVKCFSYIPYRQALRSQQTPKGASFRHALNFSDFWRETRDGSVYMWRTARGKEAEFEARRRTHFERAMGKSRTLAVGVKKDLPPEPHHEGDDDSEGEDFLVPNSRLLGDAKERRSNERAPERRSKQDAEEYPAKPSNLPTHGDEEMALHPDQATRGQRSWWSRMYDRISGDDQVQEENVKRGRKKHPKDVSFEIVFPLGVKEERIRAHAMRAVDLDEPPPPSLFGRRQKSGHAQDIDRLPSEKRPFLDWDPTITQPPRVPGQTLHSSEKNLGGENLAAPETRTSAPIERLELHQRDDSLLGRIFARSSEHGHEPEHEKPASKLPSLFLRKQDVAGAVKGWDLSKALPAEPVQSKDLPTTAKSAEPADIPSIPSPSPSPPRLFPKPTPTVVPPTTVQPTPVLHPTLSYARRPSLLIADEAGILPALGMKSVLPQSEGRTQSWVQATHKHIKPVPPVVAPPANTMGRNERPKRTEGPPLSGSIRQRGHYPTRGPRKPAKVVMPTPLSPARYPGGETVVSHSHAVGTSNGSSMRHALPPGAGYGPPPAVAYVPPFPTPYVYDEPPMPSHIEPYQMYTQNWSRPAPVVQPVERYSRLSQREQQHPQRNSKRSPSPFGIQAPVSDAESLPRHPGARQQTARRRRESQPLPSVPDQRSPTAPQQQHRQVNRRRSEPLQSSYNADMSNSPSPSAANLNSSPASPSSAHGDSRYPRPTNYFEHHSTNPYLTTIMNDAIAPVIVVPSVPEPTSPARRLKRR